MNPDEFAQVIIDDFIFYDEPPDPQAPAQEEVLNEDVEDNASVSPVPVELMMPGELEEEEQDLEEEELEEHLEEEEHDDVPIPLPCANTHETRQVFIQKMMKVFGEDSIAGVTSNYNKPKKKCIFVVHIIQNNVFQRVKSYANVLRETIRTVFVPDTFMFRNVSLNGHYGDVNIPVCTVTMVTKACQGHPTAFFNMAGLKNEVNRHLYIYILVTKRNSNKGVKIRRDLGMEKFLSSPSGLTFLSKLRFN